MCKNIAVFSVEYERRGYMLCLMGLILELSFEYELHRM